MLSECSTLVDLLRWRTLQQSEQQAYTFLIDGEAAGPALTYAELDCQARAIGALLQQHKARGERALLLYPPGLEFIAAFCGCLYAGVIAIPAPPPDAARLKRTLPRLQAIAKDAQASLVLTTSRILSIVEDFRAQVAELQAMRWLATEQLNSELAEAWQDPKLSRDPLAYLQYTSGSTSTPKGVMVSHGNLMHHAADISQAWGYTPDSIAATWMPYFHDYGLVDGLIQPLYEGIPCFVMSPLTFVKRPFRWLQTISRYKVTHSQGPNFAYDHCVRRIKPEQFSNLDLSSWRTASNGAEPIRKETLERFVAAFAPYGFCWSAFYPAYGLAEATLLVSTKRHTSIPLCRTIQAAALEQNQIVEASKHQSGVQTLVGCGHPIGDLKVVIAHPETLIACADNQVGEIWVSSPNVAVGYWNRPEETASTFQAYLADTGEGPFLRTGDLGFKQDGELFVTGRLKDLIIIRGRNLYPQDIEFIVEQSHPALRPSCGAVFAVDVASEERLVVVQEVERQSQNLDINEVVEAIRKAVAEKSEVEVYAVLLLKTGSIFKTSSGKIQRSACRAGFLDGSLEVVGTWTSNKVLDDQAIVGAAPADISRERADKIIDWLRTYANERINSRLIDERRCIPPYVVLDFGNRGILGMQVPEQYGGMALNNRDAMRVVEQLAAIDLTLATFVCINNFLGIRPIQQSATKTVRDELLPMLAQGRELAAFALTELGAGSNPRAISTTGIADAQGGWRLRGTKIWSGSASWAGLINVFVQLDDKTEPNGITGFVVRQGTSGLRQGPESLTLGMRGVVQNTIYLDDVPVDASNLLGKPGSGMAVAQDAMLFTRLAIGAMSVGGMKRCSQLMLRYATLRDIATGRLIDNPVTLSRLSDLTAAIAALETLVTRIAELLDNGCFVPREAYIACKTSGPELLWQAADSLVQLLGGRGYIETNIAPQLLRDARVFRIFEGPTETLNMFLGSSVFHQSEDLHRFLCNELGAEAIWDTLRDAAERISARWSDSTALALDRPSALRLTHMRIGELATYAILQAAAELAVNRTPSIRWHRAALWARSQFEHALARALTDTPGESVLLSANETKALISSYAEAIGELEQTLAGEEHALDELLRCTRELGGREEEQARGGEGARGNRKSSNGKGVNSLSEHSPPASPAPSAPPTPYSPLPTPCAQRALDHTSESIEAWLAKWLADELRIKVDAIDTRKSFVNYGLDSVTSIRLTDDLEVRLGRQLSPTLAWDYPSISALAQHLTEKSGVSGSLALKQARLEPERGSATRSSLLAIQPNGSKSPLFCMHAAGGGALYYRTLVPYLCSEQPVYGLQAKGLDGKQSPLTRVEDMAAYYIEQIYTLQPSGPYFLGGSSFGGLIAFEMAQQLHAQGQEVALLALFDTISPIYHQFSFRNRVSNHLLLGPKFTIERVKGKSKLLKSRLQERTQKIAGKFSRSMEEPKPYVSRDLLIEVEAANKQALRDYVSQVYPNEVTLFRAINQPKGASWYHDAELGWGELAAGGVEIHQVLGDHLSLFTEPEVTRVLAEKLQACLERAQMNRKANRP